MGERVDLGAIGELLLQVGAELPVAARDDDAIEAQPTGSSNLKWNMSHSAAILSPGMISWLTR